MTADRVQITLNDAYECDADPCYARDRDRDDWGCYNPDCPYRIEQRP